MPYSTPTFRNSYLTEVDSRLAAINLTTATTNDLLAAGALYKMGAAVAEADFVGPSALRYLETMNVSQFNAWVADASNRDAFIRILDDRPAARAIARNSTIMALLTASALAMNDIFDSKVALTEIFNHAAALTTFKASSVITAASIPTMTANDAPSGYAAASSINSGAQDAWKAMDKTSGGWSSSTVITNQWLRYSFAAPVFIHTLDLTSANLTLSPKNCRFERSLDGLTWETLIGFVVQMSASVQTFVAPAAGRCQHWRVFVENNWGGTTINIGEIQLTGFQ